MQAKAFLFLHTLELIDNKDGFVYEPGLFDGLNSLASLRVKNTKIRHIDHTFMTDIARTLLQFEMVSSFCEKSMNKLTENVSLPLLESFHLEDTRPLGALSARNISGFEKISSLKLIKCGIHAIDKSTFDSINGTLKVLALNNNHLKVLQENTFDNLLKFNMRNISLTGNQWRCDHHRKYIEEKFRKCNISFEPDCDWNVCKHLSNGSIYRNFSLHLDIKKRKIVTAMLNSTSMNEISIAVLHFEHKIDQQMRFTYVNQREQHCAITTIKNGNTIETPIGKNQRDGVHTVCIMEKKRKTINPLNCYSFTELADQIPKECVIMTKKFQTAAFCSFISLSVFAFCFGATIAYAVFRNQPVLLKRICDRVVVLKGGNKRRTTVMIMPKGFKKYVTILL